MWSIAEFQRSSDEMASLETSLAHSRKRRRSSSTPEAEGEDSDGDEVANAEEDDPPDDDDDEKLATCSSDSAKDGESADDTKSADHDRWAMHLQVWPLPAGHPEAGDTTTLETSLCTYVKWNTYLYRVNYMENALHLVTDEVASYDWAEMDGGDPAAFWRFSPLNARFYPDTMGRMGHL